MTTTRLPYSPLPPSQRVARMLGDRDRRAIRRHGARACRDVARSFRQGHGARAVAGWNGITNPRTVAVVLRAGLALLACEGEDRAWRS